MTVTFDPRSPDQLADPYPIFKRLRKDDPVHWSDGLGGWLISRFADCRAVMLDARFSADRMSPFFDHLPAHRRASVATLESSIGQWAVFQDPPDHTRLRGLLNRAFTSRAVARLQPRIAALVDELIDGFAGRDEIDFVADFAYPLPASVIMDMLGVPLALLPEFKTWSDDIALFVGSAYGDGEKYARAELATRAMSEVFRDLARSRRSKPAEDMISDLCAAEEAGGRLGEDELIATCVLLLFAGHETTAGLLSAGLHHLLRHREQLAALRADPALAENAVEEMLRYDPPTGAMVRIARQDVALHGRRIRAGDRIFVMLMSANRDEAMFEDAERFDIRREPNRQIAFGHGIHFCLGAPLARLETRIALPRLLRRVRRIEALEPRPDWTDSLVLRALRRLPLRIDLAG